MGKDFLNAIKKWQEFLKNLVRFVKTASGETH